MKRKRHFLFFLSLIIITIVGCDDIVEEDLKRDQIWLKNPNDSLRTTFATQTFMWYDVNGADRYQIQIVNGSFTQLNFFVLDSSILGTQFVYNLEPGKYQWRVKAYNSVSETEYTTRTIQIDSTSDLMGQSVLLSSPSDNDFLNDPALGLSWQALYNADEYIVQVRQNSSSGALVYTDTTSSVDIQKGTLNLSEGKYAWGVKATNNSSSTNFSNRFFTLDVTAPSAPSISNVDSIQSGTFTINWERTANDVSIDSLYIFGNSTGTNIQRNVEANSSYFDSLSNGVYYWKVKSIDKAGNIGSFSTQKRLEIR